MRLAVVVFIGLVTISKASMPDTYYKIKNQKSAKKYFFTYMSKIANRQNNYILDDRKFIKYFFPKKDLTAKLNKEYKRFEKIQKKYKLKFDDSLEKYLLHIDIIPVSLVLAQAAVESAWGKSRFIKEAKNVFGQWTWTEKGLVPKNRDVGKTHKIKIFSAIDLAVYDYMKNLNTNRAYKEFRRVRKSLRDNHKKISGLILAKTLINYSQKKEEYTKILGTIIIHNNLERFDK